MSITPAIHGHFGVQRVPAQAAKCPTSSGIAGASAGWAGAAGATDFGCPSGTSGSRSQITAMATAPTTRHTPTPRARQSGALPVGLPSYNIWLCAPRVCNVIVVATSRIPEVELRAAAAVQHDRRPEGPYHRWRPFIVVVVDVLWQDCLEELLCLVPGAARARRGGGRPWGNTGHVVKREKLTRASVRYTHAAAPRPDILCCPSTSVTLPPTDRRVKRHRGIRTTRFTCSETEGYHRISNISVPGPRGMVRSRLFWK